MSFSKLRTWAEIDLDAVVNNIELIRAIIPEKTKIMAVIKADGYGHGSTMLAGELEKKADYFAVAMLDEAIELRKSGILKPILVLSYSSPELFPVFVKYKVIPTLFTYSDAEAMDNCADKMSVKMPIHIAVDTGMSRIGFPDDEKSVDEIKKIYNLKNIILEGIFSHFAAADEKDKTHALMQKKRFEAFIQKLSYIGVEIPIKHLYNSAATIDFENEYDMVREGIILYGLLPSFEVNLAKIKGLQPVMTLKTHVIHVKTIFAGATVSYGHTYTADKEIRVATLCAGYADGVPRILSGKGKVLIHGKEAPILGRVCMDQIMVDVTDIPDVFTGDDAVIFGKDGKVLLPADEVAALAQTIGYELTCGITKRVPRLYFKNGKCVEKKYGITHEE